MFGTKLCEGGVNSPSLSLVAHIMRLLCSHKESLKIINGV
jgi:hypothetical protein